MGHSLVGTFGNIGGSSCSGVGENDCAVPVSVICLQEVTDRVLRKLMQDKRVQKRYRICSSAEQASRFTHFVDGYFYGVAMMIAKSLPTPIVRHAKLPSRMGRSVLVAEFPLNNNENGGDHSSSSAVVAIATVHLESLESQLARNKQLEIIVQQVLDQYEFAMLVGDYNITATGPWGNPTEHAVTNKLLSNGGYVDLWVREHGTDGDVEGSDSYDASITFDKRATSPMLAADAAVAGRPAPDIVEHSRLDRMFVKEGIRRHRLVAKDIRVIGRSPISPDAFISDHYGLICELALANGTIAGSY
jgi:endonuclease/exonuclease/phosphatase family metal-dependent hydrolase